MVLRAALVALLATLAVPALSQEIATASFDNPTRRYDHGILGDAIEYGGLLLTFTDGRSKHITLPKSRVFEDLAPRVVDLDFDGMPEVIVVETHVNKGAQLAIYGAGGKITATPHIGRSHRWLAPIGAADLDGDGHMEIAYIDRPHLARLLKIWRYRGGKLRLVAQQGGLTNHRIGEGYISGGIRDCGAGPQLVTASADWSQIVTVMFDGKSIRVTAIGKHKGPKSFKRALACRM